MAKDNNNQPNEPQAEQAQNAVVVQPQEPKKMKLPAKLEQSGIGAFLMQPKRAFIAAGGTEQQFAREINFAIDILAEKDYVLQCATNNPEAFVSAIKNVGLTGLTLNPELKQGYLVPRKGKVVFQSSYMGKRDILTRCGIVKSIEAQLVYEGDEFEFIKGINEKLHHKPDVFGDRSKDKLKGGYWIAKLVNGETVFDAVPKSRIYDIMRRSEAVKSGKGSPWDTDFEQMAKKTILNAAFSQLPKSGISEDMLKVLHTDMEYDEEDIKDFAAEQSHKDTFTEDAEFQEVK